jgi:hypothetical protein
MVGRTTYVPPLPRDLARTDHYSSEEYRYTHLDAWWQELEYHIDVCRVTRGAHLEPLLVKQKIFSFPVAGKIPYGKSFGFLVTDISNHGERHEMPCT